MTKTRTLLIAGVALCGMAAGSTANAYDRHVDLINRSHGTITHFFASNVGTDDWEDDVLGEFVLRPGYHVHVDLDDGSGYCRFDFKTVFQDGTDIIRRNVDVCTLTRYTLTD
jgi:hypothetical protein